MDSKTVKESSLGGDELRTMIASDSLDRLYSCARGFVGLSNLWNLDPEQENDLFSPLYKRFALLMVLNGLLQNLFAGNTTEIVEWLQTRNTDRPIFEGQTPFEKIANSSLEELKILVDYFEQCWEGVR